MSKPLASITVQLPRAITGSGLMAAVKAVAEENKTSFYSDHHFDDGDAYLIGQVSGYPYDHILVAPKQDNSSVRPDESYNQVVVMSHSWPVSTYMVGYADDAPIKVVQIFAEALKRYLSGVSEDTKSSVWPQEVTVCAVCQHIVSRSFDETYCPNDGKNPPTRTIKVVPVTS